jgi:hypothetical protein
MPPIGANSGASSGPGSAGGPGAAGGVDSSTSKVRVVVRTRPPAPSELRGRKIVHIPNNQHHQQHGANKAIAVGDKVFHYDHVFDEQSTQDVIFDCGVREMVEGCFEGFNATVFAYGQTVRVSIIFALVFYIGVK